MRQFVSNRFDCANAAPYCLAAHKPLTVFVPYDSPHDRKLLGSLRRQGPVLLLARSEADLKYAEPGVWTLVAPNQPRLYQTALAHAQQVVSGDPHVQLAALRCREALEPRAPLSSTERFAFCCVADTQYLPFFFALVENLRACHTGPLEIHLLAVDADVEPAVRAQYPDLPIRIYPFREVWTDEEWERISRRPLGLQALTAKPRIFWKARQNSDAEALFLLDLDMYFFRSPARLNGEFAGAHTLFFPQWSDRFTWARLHGIFNSGLIGARRGAEPFLAWWSRACWISCELEVEQGRFGDQAFIDQAILYFDGIRIYREHDEDVAPWNRKTLQVGWVEDELQVRGGKPVGSFHAAGPDDDGIFERKYAWDQLVAAFSVFKNPNESGALYRNTLEQQRRHWPSLDRALRLRQLAEQRLPVKTAHATPDWGSRAVSPAGRVVLGALSYVHATYGKWRGHSAGQAPEIEYDFWVQLQRTALFHPEKLL